MTWTEATVWICPVCQEQVPDDPEYDPTCYHREWGGHLEALRHRTYVRVPIGVEQWHRDAPVRVWSGIYEDWTEYGPPLPRKPVTFTGFAKAMRDEFTGAIRDSIFAHNRVMWGQEVTIPIKAAKREPTPAERARAYWRSWAY